MRIATSVWIYTHAAYSVSNLIYAFSWNKVKSLAIPDPFHNPETLPKIHDPSWQKVGTLLYKIKLEFHQVDLVDSNL